MKNLIISILWLTRIKNGCLKALKQDYSGKKLEISLQVRHKGTMFALL